MSLPPPPASPTPGNYTMPAERKTNGAALASLICGILGCIPVITGLLAVILGIVGLKKSKDPHYGGKGLAIAGLILGLLSIVGWVGFGGASWLTYNKIMGLSAPARAVGKTFVTAVYENHPDQAAAISTISSDDLTKYATTVSKPNVTVADITFIPAMNYVNGETWAQLTGIIKKSDGSTSSCTIRVDKQGDTWKVTEFTGQ